MPDCLEVEIWRIVLYLIFFHSLYWTILLVLISVLFKWHQYGFLPPLQISRVEVQFPLQPESPKECPEQYLSVGELIHTIAYMEQFSD